MNFSEGLLLIQKARASCHVVAHLPARHTQLQFQVVIRWWVLISLNEGVQMIQIIIWGFTAGNTQSFPLQMSTVCRRKCYSCEKLYVTFLFSSKSTSRQSSVLFIHKTTRLTSWVCTAALQCENTQCYKSVPQRKRNCCFRATCCV